MIGMHINDLRRLLINGDSEPEPFRIIEIKCRRKIGVDFDPSRIGDRYIVLQARLTGVSRGHYGSRISGKNSNGAQCAAQVGDYLPPDAGSRNSLIKMRRLDGNITGGAVVRRCGRSVLRLSSGIAL